MLQSFRNYPIIGLLIMGGLVIVFAISGIFSGGGQAQGPAVVGTVNGDPIISSEFRRAYERRVQMFRNYGIKDDQMRSMRIAEGVWEEMVTRKLVLALTQELGLKPSDSEVLDMIRTSYPVFQKDGAFDAERYKQVLASNNLSPADFERMLREEIQVSDWQNYFAPAALVTPTELKWEHALTGDRRKLRYVFLPTDVVKKLKSEQVEGIRKDLTARAPDAKVEASLKEFKIKPVTTDWISAKAEGLPGVGESQAVLRDAFAEKSDLNLKSGGAARKYDLVTGSLIVTVVDAERPSGVLSSADRLRLVRELTERRARDFSARVVRNLKASAKIKKNAVVMKQFEG